MTNNASCMQTIKSLVGGGSWVVVSTAAFHARVWSSVPGLGGLKETKLFLPHPRVKVSIVGSLRDREVACSVSDRQGSNFESCVWRTVSSQSFHHPQEVLLAQFSLYVHKVKDHHFKVLFSIYISVYNKYAVPPYSTAAQHLARIGPTLLFAGMYFHVYSKTPSRLQGVSFFWLYSAQRNFIQFWLSNSCAWIFLLYHIITRIKIKNRESY